MWTTTEKVTNVNHNFTFWLSSTNTYPSIHTYAPPPNILQLLYNQKYTHQYPYQYYQLLYPVLSPESLGDTHT